MLALIQEEIVMFVLIAYLFFEQIFYLLQICKSIHIRYFVLFGIVIYFVVVQFMVTTYYRTYAFENTFALDQKVGQNVVLSYLSQLHQQILQSQRTFDIFKTYFVETIIKLILLKSIGTLQFEMFEEGYILDYDCDTSIKKYPYNKYYNGKELAKLTKKVFRSKSTDPSKLKQKKCSKKNKKSLMSTKTMSSSRARATSRQYNTIVSITPQNYRAFTKDDLASELHHYKELCFELRKQNHSLKTKMDEKSRGYKDNLVNLQSKINRFNEKSLELKEKELKIERERMIDEKTKELNKKRNGKGKIPANHRQLEGQFKRFFLHFIDSCGKIDEKAHKKLNQKNMDGKLLLSQKLLRQSCDYLIEKKYKFKSVYE